MLDLGTLGSQTDRHMLVALLTSLIAAQQRDHFPSSTPCRNGPACFYGTRCWFSHAAPHVLPATAPSQQHAALLQQGHSWRPLRRRRRRPRLRQPTTPQRHHGQHQRSLVAAVFLKPSFSSSNSFAPLTSSPTQRRHHRPASLPTVAATPALWSPSPTLTLS